MCYPPRIRTLNNWTKTNCVTVTPEDKIVDQIGIEPITFTLWVCRSNLVSYKSILVISFGFEPKTHILEGCCSIQLSYETKINTIVFESFYLNFMPYGLLLFYSQVYQVVNPMFYKHFEYLLHDFYSTFRIHYP